MGTLNVKDWSIFQHYKDRNPPWIKLQTNLFQNYEFSRLQDASKLLALCIWTLAARSKDGSVPHDLAWIKGQCGLGDIVTQSNLKELISMGYLITSDVLADCKQSAMPETETETEILFTNVNNIKPKKSEKLKMPSDVSEGVWEDFVKHRKAKRAPVTETVINSIRREALKIAWTLDRALAEVCARGWQGFKAEWITNNQSKGNQNATTHNNLTKAQRADIALGIVNPGTNERMDGSIADAFTPVLRQLTEIR